MQILITSPSLNETENVSGISSLVREIISASACEFSHFIAGRKDSDNEGVGWIFKQLILPLQFYRKIRRESPDIVHINTALVPRSILRDAALTFAAKIAGARVVLHLHGGRFLIEDFDNRFIERITAAMLSRAERILVLSDFEKEHLTKRWKDLNIEVLPNAVSIDKCPPVEKNSDVKTIIFFGRIHESKGLDEIIEACKTLKSEDLTFNFRCFGAGPEKDVFIAQMTKILGEKFYYGGVVAGENKWRELAEADIFLLPSRYGEGLPLAMLEAMAARCVPVVADVASVRSVIKDGENGFMVEPYNAAQTAEKLKNLLSGKANWNRLSENARKTVEEKFSISEYITKLEKLYAEIRS
ncbi:MAG: glycosyltransferase family 4 protein [Pyrinomonadaceae bacterium]|nr:glycosyltransferase family 4 protein [Pyrinomonadaceae bacterium]